MDPLAMVEYSTDIAGPAIQLIQIDDCEMNTSYELFEKEFHEYVLNTRPGRDFHVYARKCNMSKLMEHIRKIKQNELQLYI